MVNEKRGHKQQLIYYLFCDEADMSSRFDGILPNTVCEIS